MGWWFLNMFGWRKQRRTEAFDEIYELSDEDSFLPITVDMLSPPPPRGFAWPRRAGMSARHLEITEFKRVTVHDVQLATVLIFNLEDCFLIQSGRRSAYIPHPLDAQNYTFLSEQCGRDVVIHFYRNHARTRSYRYDNEKDFDSFLDA